jgi:hypothetical protein
MSTKSPKPATRTSLAKRYGVSVETLKKWLVKVPHLVVDRSVRVFTPRQVEQIFDHLGKPDD